MAKKEKEVVAKKRFVIEEKKFKLFFAMGYTAITYVLSLGLFLIGYFAFWFFVSLAILLLVPVFPFLGNNASMNFLMFWSITLVFFLVWNIFYFLFLYEGFKTDEDFYYTEKKYISEEVVDDD